MKANKRSKNKQRASHQGGIYNPESTTNQKRKNISNDIPTKLELDKFTDQNEELKTSAPFSAATSGCQL